VDTQEKIRQTVQGNKVVLFMKGSPQFPQCGFSAKAIQIWAERVRCQTRKRGAVLRLRPLLFTLRWPSSRERRQKLYIGVCINNRTVIPAKAGIHGESEAQWIPAFAGMTDTEN
jgi:hypothetical protein